LLADLIGEGLLTEDRFWSHEDILADGIRVSYERLSDYLIAEHLLAGLPGTNGLANAFQPDGTLGRLFSDEYACWENRRLLVALCVLVPERFDCELAELAPHAADFQALHECFVKSLIWRNPTKVTDGTLRYVNEHIILRKDSQRLFLDALLTVAGDPDHPYNADFLHAHLERLRLADRDSWWSIYLHDEHDTRTAVD